MEAAAGIASVIKVALALYYGQLPPTLHYQTPNPAIPFADLGLRVQDTLTPWAANEAGELVAGVSAFGFGGANAHAVLRLRAEWRAPIQADAPAHAGALADTDERVPKPILLPLSARDPAALTALAQRYADLLQPAAGQPAVNLEHVGYSASRSRPHHNHRLALVGSDPADIAARLHTFVANPQTAIAPSCARSRCAPSVPGRKTSQPPAQTRLRLRRAGPAMVGHGAATAAH